MFMVLLGFPLKARVVLLLQSCSSCFRDVLTIRCEIPHARWCPILSHGCQQKWYSTHFNSIATWFTDVYDVSNTGRNQTMGSLKQGSHHRMSTSPQNFSKVWRWNKRDSEKKRPKHMSWGDPGERSGGNLEFIVFWLEHIVGNFINLEDETRNCSFCCGVNILMGFDIDMSWSSWNGDL